MSSGSIRPAGRSAVLWRTASDRVSVRVAAVVTIALLVVYHLTRAAATACSGPACDWYIPVSLLLPLMILAGAVVTGVTATSAARNDATWRIVLGACTAISVAGPIVALIVLRDSPDPFVVSSTILVLIAPAAALVYSFMPRTDAVVR